MELKDWIFTGLGLIMSLIAFIWKREMESIKGENNEIKTMIKDREDRNYTAHKEIWSETNSIRERVTRVEATQERCSTCRGE